MEDKTILIGTWVLVTLIFIVSWLFLEEVEFDITHPAGGPISTPYSTPSSTPASTPAGGSGEEGEEDEETGTRGTPGTPTPGTPAPGTPAPGTPAPGTPAPNGRRVPDSEIIQQETYDRSSPIAYSDLSDQSYAAFQHIQTDTPLRAGAESRCTGANFPGTAWKPNICETEGVRRANLDGFPDVPGYHACPDSLKNTLIDYRRITGANMINLDGKVNLNSIAAECDTDTDCLGFSADSHGKGKYYKANDKSSEKLSGVAGVEELFKHRPLYIKKYPNLNVKGMSSCTPNTMFYPQIMS